MNCRYFGLLLIILTVLSPCETICSKTSFKIPNGKVFWPTGSARDGLNGFAYCNEGYEFIGTEDVVWCPNSTLGYVLYDKKATCTRINDVPSKIVDFHGITYNMTYIAVGSKTQEFDVTYPNTSYILTTTYNASKATPTIRVRVGLVGKAHSPVLINIQQSTESVGFELPMKVVGRGGSELQPLTSHTVELCPVTLKVDKNGDLIPQLEHVQITMKGGERASSQSKPTLQVHVTAAQHMDLVPDKPAGPTNVDDTESLVYRYQWPKNGSITEVDLEVTHFLGDKGHNEGKGADVCAKLSIRSGGCPLEEMGIHELTFTREAYITVSKYDKRLKDIEKGFLVVIEVFPDDSKCQSDVNKPLSPARTKSLQVVLRAKKPPSKYIYIAFPVVTCCIIVVITWLLLVLFIKPLNKNAYDDGMDESLVNVDVPPTLALLSPETSLDPPFEKQPEFIAKEVDLEEVNMEVPDDDEAVERGSENSGEEEDGNRKGDELDDLLRWATRGDSRRWGELWNIVKKNEVIISITRTIGHCSIPILVFLNSFDAVFIDIQGNLKEHTENGDMDTCYVNSKCAYPGTIYGYRIPDVARVFSNCPYIVCAFCFWYLARQKSKVMAPINRRGRGVKHDFAIFDALALITGLVGISSAIYHVCPNQTTSRIDMYFIEILLGYYSLKLYQSRVPDIRSVYYMPAIVICVLSAIERVMGGSPASWITVGAFHCVFTFWVSVQLFFLGKVTMSPLKVYRNFSHIKEKFSEQRSKPEFFYQAGFCSVGIVSTIILSTSAGLGYWNDQSMYNVAALSSDIVIYMMYYLVTKCVLRKETVRTNVVVLMVTGAIVWAVSFIMFFTYKNIDTDVSPAESRCLNRPCVAGFLDGHDLWHCLSATAIFLTNTIILMMDDDLINTRTEDTYF